MEVRRTHNVDLILETVAEPRLFAASNEDGATPEELRIDTRRVTWLALIDDERNVRGFVVGVPRGRATMELHVAIKPQFWGDSKPNVELGKMAVAWLAEHGGVRKFVACIPTEDKQVVRYAQRVGLQREGVNKQSYLRNGEMIDQYHLGLVIEPGE